MDAETIQKILTLATPNTIEHEDKVYVDKELKLVIPPAPKAVECSTLQGLVDLHDGELDNAKANGELLVHITSPTEVELISRESDSYGRRRVWARAEYPKGCTTFPFGQWLNPENFVILAQAGFQRVKIETDDGSMAQDLDYILKIASAITAEAIETSEDDGISQKASLRRGVVLKDQQNLRPLVNLAPYRTFAEIDQVVSRFVFRARTGNDSIQLALFEGDGGRWRLDAVATIAAWLKPKFGDVPVIS